MAVCSYGRSALALALFGTAVAPVRGTDYPFSIVVEADGAFSLDRGDTITIDGPGVGRGVEVRRRGSLDAYDVYIHNRSSGNRTRHAYGLLAFGKANVFIGNSRIAGSGARSIGVHAQDLSTVTLQNVTLGMSAADSVGISSRSGGIIGVNGVTLRMEGDNAIGVLAAGTDSRIVGSGLSLVHAGKRSGAAAPFDSAESVAVSGGAHVALSKSSLLTEQPGVNAVSIQGATSTFHVSDTRVVAEGAGSSAITLAGGVAAIAGGEVRGAGYAIRAVNGQPGDASIRVTDGARINGRIENAAQAMTFTAEHSHVHGDIVGAGGGPLRVSLDSTTWQGRGERLAELNLADSAWVAAGDSSVHRLTLLGQGRVAFDEGAPASRLDVGTFANPEGQGSVVLRTRLDAGGAMDRQLTDRLLVAGDVIGSTSLHILPMGGAGADTSPLTRVPQPGDGISVVQVGGNAGADSFRLAGGYVAAGPWQYRLVAYAPGSSDVGQRLLDAASAHWDFRLQSHRTDASGNPVDDDRRRDPAALPVRARLVPQVPAYLVLAHALFGYGRTAMDAWRPVEPAAARDSAWHVRAFGGHAIYRSSLPFARYAVDYARTDRGLHVAGELLAWSSAEATMRAGLGLSTGSTSIAPRAVDGVSRAKADARGIAATYALTTESGWHTSASYGFTHYRVDVHTPSRGEALGRLRANANEASLEAGFRWHPVERVTIEPAASLLWQRLRFARATDRDRLVVRPGTPERMTLRSGARVSMRFEPRGNVLDAWSPYIDARYVVTRGTGESIDISSVRLATGKAGRATDIAAGAALQFRADLTAYVDIGTRTRLGHGGESAMSARAGMVYTF
ncbi:MAG TPA: autotransporter outer membrane beta-barrel domain-containing protein [Luteibacter sp.]|uniref:autotransporter outer membrane beta-barrel domain-containing protein n=1 Tax=Luteibacter sp. TaxID=1886636 RepID=UPI002BB7DD3E|nr:autotransporter outer membrane beta-barrel domain-containing protein [Luteibacter sp.]HVI56920.1 autotransporter outer membrane beta-barrel domain-containing protein [Luteibacter sp.]